MIWHKRVRQISLVFVLVLSFVSMPQVFAQDESPAPVGGTSLSPKGGVCEGVGLVTGKSCDDANAQAEAQGKVEGTVQLVVDILSWIVGIAAVIMIIIGGFKYVTSSGDSGSVTSAKNTILFAVIGLIVVVLAQVIVSFVANTVDKTTQTKTPPTTKVLTTT